MGTNSKLNVQFVDRHWRSLGGSGLSACLAKHREPRESDGDDRE